MHWDDSPFHLIPTLSERSAVGEESPYHGARKGLKRTRRKRLQYSRFIKGSKTGMACSKGLPSPKKLFKSQRRIINHSVDKHPIARGERLELNVEHLYPACVCPVCFILHDNAEIGGTGSQCIRL